MSKIDSNPDQELDSQIVDRLNLAMPVNDTGEVLRQRMRNEIVSRSRVHGPIPKRESRNDPGDAGFNLDALTTARPDEVGQWKQLAPGLEKQLLFSTGQCEGFLLRLAPGAAIPEHEHARDEECVVVSGSVMVDGLEMTAGTFHLAPAGVLHRKIISEAGALLFIKSGHFRQGGLAVAG